MNSLGEILREYGPAYRAKFGLAMLPSHLRAMLDIERCRTAALGGHVYHCDDCDQFVYSYHSCQNRHCPQCQQEAGQIWLERQQELLLPAPYFLVTFTLPEELRDLARSQQQLIYDVLFRTSAAALQELAADPRFVGGQIGLLGVLQTWARDLSYHPHIHYLAPGVGLTPQGQVRRAKKDFLVHVKPLSKLFRAKFRAELQKTDGFRQVPPAVWSKKWVVHCQAVGRGEAALKYLAPYIFRVALSNKRLVKVENDQVTFRYQESRSHKSRYCTLPAEEFIRRFLQHVLPKGFVKVRYYGLFSPSYRPQLSQLRLRLAPPVSCPVNTASPVEPVPAAPSRAVRCPTCHQPMRLVETLKPHYNHSPPPTSTGLIPIEARYP